MLRRSLRTQITTRVVALSAAAALVLGASLIVLIVAVTGQRDAARTAFRSQQALSVADQLEKSLLSIENGLNRYVSTERESFLVPVRRELALYPARTRAARGPRSPTIPASRPALARSPGRSRTTTTSGSQSLIEIAREDGFAQGRSQIETNGGRARLDAIRTRFARLFERERAVIRARERKAESRSSRAIGFGLGGLGLLVVVRDRLHAVPAPLGPAAGPHGRRGDRPARRRRPDHARAGPARGRARRARARLQHDGRLARARPRRARALQRRAVALQRRARAVRVGHVARPAGAADDDLDVRRAARPPPRRRRARRERRQRRPRPRRRHPRRDAAGARADPRPARVLAGGPRPARARAGAGRADRRPGARGARRHDRGERRADHRRRAAGRAGRPRESLPRLSESRRQRGEVHRRRDSPREHRRRARGRPLALLGARQRNRHEPQERRAHLRALPAPARRGGLPRHRHRPGRLRADRRPARRAHLGLQPPGEGSVFHFTLPAALPAGADPAPVRAGV